MLHTEDILSLEYLKKTEYTGSHQGMRFRLEKISVEDTNKLLVTVWPEPYNYANTPEEEKQRNQFTFDNDGIVDAVAWMNDRLFEEKDRWESSASRWDMAR